LRKDRVQSKCVARVDNYGKSPKHKITGFETPHVLRKVGRANGSFKRGTNPKARGSNTSVAIFTKKGHPPHENDFKTPPGLVTLDNKGPKCPEHQNISRN
jgi:hypothetical protein